MEDRFCESCDCELVEYEYDGKGYCADCLLDELEEDKDVETWETKSYLCCGNFIGDTNSNSSYEIIDELKTYFDIKELEED